MSKLHIVMYHYVRDLENSRYPNIKGLDYKLFKQQIQFFSEHFNVVRMEEVIAYYNDGYKLPENAMLLTFDDGYIDHFTYVFPILKEYKMQGTFFVPGKTFTEHCLLDVNKIHYLLASASIEELCKELCEQMDYYRKDYDYPSNKELFFNYAVESRFDKKEVIFFKKMLQTILPEEIRNQISSDMLKSHVGISEEILAHELYLNYDQMRCMKAQGMFFGMHGYDHYRMNHLELSKLKNDIRVGLDVMSGLIDVKSWVINYPYGAYNEDVVNYVKSMGCALGLSTDVRIANLETDNRYILPRMDTNDYPPKNQKFRLDDDE